MATVDDLVFVGLQGKVLALDRATGGIVWRWVGSTGSFGGVPMLLLDGDRVVVSVNGYLTCLDAQSGAVLWHNPLKGEGVGLVSLASVRGGFGGALLAAAEQAQSSTG